MLSTTEFRTNYPTVDLTNYSDATLSGIISTATNRVIEILQYDPRLQDITDEKLVGKINNDGNLVLFPEYRPINSVSNLKIVKGSTEVNLTLTANNRPIYDIQNNIVYISTYEIGYNTVSMLDFSALRGTNFFCLLSYNAGYSSLPTSIKYAVELLVLDRLMLTTNVSGAKSVSQGGIKVEYETKRGKSSYEERVEELLKDYIKI